MAVIDSYSFYSGNIPVKISIESDRNEFVLVYKVSISQISPNTEIVLDKIRDELVDKVKLGIGDVTDPKKLDYVKEKFRKTIVSLIKKYFPDITDDTLDFFTTYLMHKSFGLGKIELLMKDKSLEEIVINNSDEPVWVYHHKYGWLKTNIILKEEGLIKHYSSLIGRRVGRSITLLTPLLDATLDTGDRVNATISPISSKGNTITIRKFSAEPITITKFLQNQVLSFSTAALVWLGVEYESSMIISGGTASGKTSLLNAVGEFFPPNQRIISVEDTREIALPKYLHWVPMLTRLPNIEGRGGVTMLDLIVNSLRMRPDRIMVGEIRRKEEAETLFEAMHTGHSVYATLHANSAEETVNRLVNPPLEVPKTLLPAIGMVLIMYRNRKTGIRRIFQIAEITSDSSANVLMQYDVSQDKILSANESVKFMPELEIQTGMSNNEINIDLRNKINILKWMVKKNITDLDEIGRIVATYYTNKEGLLQFIGKN
ncbi:CpaF family protein [Candidatus Woesearchaeota archaeon]|nr:CpaF family protein [Candidatus Woesearchaeota archaeon]